MVRIVLCVTECANPPTNPFAKMSRDELRVLVASSLSVRDALGRAGAGRGSGGAFQAFNRSIEEHGLKQEYAALARRGPKQAAKRTSAVWHPEALVHASAGAESIADVVENLGLSRTVTVATANIAWSDGSCSERCPRSPTEKTAVCGTVDRGSIPREGTRCSRNPAVPSAPEHYDRWNVGC